MPRIINLDQDIYEGFLAGSLDARTSAEDVREFYALSDSIGDERIEAAMRSAASACSYPSGTVVLTVSESVEYDRRRTLSGLVWVSTDVECETGLSDEVLRALDAELSQIEGIDVELQVGDVHREDEPDVEATVYTAVLLPRLPRGEAYAADGRLDRGEVLGKVHVIHAVGHEDREAA